MPAVNAQCIFPQHIPPQQQEKILHQPYRFTVHSSRDTRNLLAHLCDKYGSDKGRIEADDTKFSWKYHTFTDFYDRHFSHCRSSVRNVFECGIGSVDPNIESNMGEFGTPGASLRVWRDYFPNAQIIGGDIDRKVLFSEDRIQTFYLDQTSELSVFGFWKQVEPVEFDLMVDDGLHNFSAGKCLFENSVQHLAPNGIYVIEDVDVHDLTLYEAYFATKIFRVDFINMYRPDSDLFNNSLVVIRG